MLKISHNDISVQVKNYI